MAGSPDRLLAVVPALVTIGLTLLVRPWFATSSLGFEPLPPTARALAGTCWNVAQLFVLFNAYCRSPRQFAAWSTIVMVAALAGAATIRYGFSMIALELSAGSLMVAAPLGLALSAVLPRLKVRSAHARATCLFVFLGQCGTVYQFTASPSEGLAALQCLAVAVLVFALLVPAPTWAMTLLDAADVASPARVATVSWLLALMLLVVNKVAIVSVGSTTPQLRLGPIGFAPYFAASGLICLAAALDLQDKTPRAIVRLGLGSLVTAVLFVWLGEHGTLAVTAVAVMLVVALIGRPVVLAGTGAIAASSFAFLGNGSVVQAIGDWSPRVAARLETWADPSAGAPAQLERAWQVLSLSGLVGQGGAARVRFLIGSEASRDYAFCLVAANGGWLGLLIVTITIVCLLKELFPGPVFASTTFRRASITGASALFTGSFLLTMLPLSNQTPFIGFPAIPLSRGGSHVIIAAVVLSCLAALSRDE